MRCREHARTGGLLCAAISVGMCSCVPRTEPVTPGERGDASERVSVGSKAAFVVYGRERTALIPVAEGESAIEVSGLWLLDEGAERPRVRRVQLIDRGDLGRPDTRYCRCGVAAKRACVVGRHDPIVDAREIDPATGDELEQSECGCYRIEPVCDGPDHPAEELAQVDSRGCTCELMCHVTGTVMTAVSIVGGELHFAGSVRNCGCGGLSLYDAHSRRLRVAAGKTLERPPPQASYHGGGSSYLEPWSRRSTWPLAYPGCRDLPRTRRIDGDAESVMDVIDAAESTLLLLRRGRFYFQVGNDSGTGNERYVFCWPARAESCLSPGDPCGGPQAFPPVVEALAEEDALLAQVTEDDTFPSIEPGQLAEHWVATDESAALLARRTSYRVFLSGQRRPTRRVDLAIDAETEAIGVRFHADAGVLVQAMRTAPPITADQPPSCVDDDDCRDGVLCADGVCLVDCGDDSDCERGQVCRDSSCEAPCTADTDCTDRGLCWRFCASSGHCVDPSDGHCDERHPCPDGEPCREGLCEAL